MEFNIENTISDMVLAVKSSVAKDFKEVEYVSRTFFEANKLRYKKLAEYRLTGKIDENSFRSRMEDEKLMLEAQFNTLIIISKVMAQNAANAAFNVLESAVKTSLKVL